MLSSRSNSDTFSLIIDLSIPVLEPGSKGEVGHDMVVLGASGLFPPDC